MKKIILITVAVLAGVGLAGLSQAAGTIVGSKHDLKAVAGTGGEICIVCHTPHNANTTASEAPLWNHTLTEASYTLYASPTLNATAITQPTGVSKLCLSCHDGTVAPDAFTDHAGTTTIAAAGNLGVDLKKSHPVSFTYDDAMAAADKELTLPSTLPAGWVNGGKFECSSCHDVHNKTGFSAMLLKENTASALCLTCHTK